MPPDEGGGIGISVFYYSRNMIVLCESLYDCIVLSESDYIIVICESDDRRIPWNI